MNETVHSPPAIRATGITKKFDGEDEIVVANNDIHLEVRSGALHAIVGENGAGKSTLAHVLAGLTRPDSGEVSIHGDRLMLANSGAAKAAGIGFVTQHFTLVETLTVWENVTLGLDLTGPWIDRDAVREMVASLASSLQIDLSPDALVETLPLPTRQAVEIIKALTRDASILILDEPTSVLGPRESELLFERINALRVQGTTVVLVTHRIQEVMDHATHVTVLRNGASVSTYNREAFDADRIIEAIIGRPATALADHEYDLGRTSVLEVDQIRLHKDGQTVLEGLSLNIHEGEIVGLAGVAGNGQTEFTQILAGQLSPSSGTLRLMSEDITNWDARQRRQHGLAYIPEDRRRSGLIGSFSIQDNLFLGGQDQFGTAIWWDGDQARQEADRLIETYGIRTPSAATPADSLSGGNQQKVVIARELSRSPRVIVAAHPTQGLDLGATDFVQTQLLDARARGCGILVISNDLDDLRALSDRIAVIYKGRIAGICSVDDYDDQQIGLWMTSGGQTP